ncbi:hypothetical protein C7M61_004934 [Candidozyma pseudohaemuli]|uniref:Uncharacterized protein n=1 Tax=Candidozyma pseudohaemuli TaxID=418784 RepID=A0A2P7YFJ6_9ASCO|nr:hypothetical protein C7M61_004934 [[Candida] pseudohaemulonii]PSK34740.1 hypothetical protein C7M61_004934 [[Candida] pseudohaemulonii]
MPIMRFFNFSNHPHAGANSSLESGSLNQSKKSLDLIKSTNSSKTSVGQGSSIQGLCPSTKLQFPGTDFSHFEELQTKSYSYHKHNAPISRGVFRRRGANTQSPAAFASIGAAPNTLLHDGTFRTSELPLKPTLHKQALSSPTKPVSLYTSPNQLNAEPLNPPFIEETPEPSLHSPEVCVQVGRRRVPHYAASIPEIRKNIPDVENLTLFQALDFALLTKKLPILRELLKQVVVTECVKNTPRCIPSLRLDAFLAESHKESFTQRLLELGEDYAGDVVEPATSSHPVSDGPAFRPRDASVTFLAPCHNNPVDHTDDVEVEKRDSRCRRIAAAISRVSHRWSARAKVFREHWRENRELRESKSKIKREIKLEKRNIKMLEREKQLADLDARLLEVSHNWKQEHKDHKQAELQRQIAAKQASNRRKLEMLEYQAVVAKANRKVAKKYKQAQAAKEAEDAKYAAYLKAMKHKAKKVAQTSKGHKAGCKAKAPKPSQKPSPKKASQKSPKPSPVVPSPEPQPYQVLNAREMEANPWHLTGDSELREAIARERPVLGVKPKKTAIGSRVVSVAPTVHSNEVLPEHVFVSTPPKPKPNADAGFYIQPIRVDAPPPPKPEGKPVWERDSYKANREKWKDVKQLRYIPEDSELTGIKGKLRNVGFQFWN